MSRLRLQSMIAGFLILGAGVLGFGPAGVSAAAQTMLAPENWSQKEAPMLHEMVIAGKLPPLAERLPDAPLVVEGKEIGRFGGTLVKGTAFLRSEWIPVTLAMEGMMHVTWPLPADGPLLANVAREWTFNDDGTELTVKLREGMKWSI